MQHAARNVSVLREPKQLRAWLAELPVMDVVETVRRLHGALEPFNELALPEDERLKLLEIYRAAYEDVLYCYDELRLRELPIEPAQRGDLAQDITWLYLGLANGYKIIVRDAHEAGAAIAQDARALLAVYRAMELIVHGLVYAWRCGQPVPPLAHLELHQLYHFAEHHGVADSPIRAIRHESHRPTVHRLYAKYLMLALGGVDDVGGPGILELYTALDRFAAACRIDTPGSRAEPAAALRTGYRIALLEDALPERMAAYSGYDEMTRVLDMGPALEAVEHSFAEETAAVGEERRLLRELARRLALGVERRHLSRPIDDRPVRLLIGLEAIRHYAGQPERLREALAVEECAGIEVRSTSDEAVYAHEHLAFRMGNENANGAVLDGTLSPEHSALAVGEIVGVIEAPAADDAAVVPCLSVGVVRWREGTDRGTRLGFEALGAGALPVSCTTGGVVRPALYFPPEASASHPAMVLVERAVFDAEGSLTVAVGKRCFEVVAERVELQTPLFACFSYRARPASAP